MAVYGRTYKAYAGPLTSHRERLMVIPRYALRELFQSKLFLMFLVLCLVPPILLCIWVYLAQNASEFKLIKLPKELVEQVLGIGPNFFGKWVMSPLLWVGFFMALVVGPNVTAPDLRNNGLPLYLSRPISRWDYIFGKLVVMLVTISAVTWVPAILIFAFKSSLSDFAWMQENFWLLGPIVIASAVWGLTLALVSLAISVSVRWKPVARLLFFAAPLVAKALGVVINGAFDTHWGSLLSANSLVTAMRAGLFDLNQGQKDLPPIAAWLVFAVISALAVWVLSHKLRAYEVER